MTAEHGEHAERRACCDSTTDVGHDFTCPVMLGAAGVQVDEPKWQIEACRSCNHAIIWARTETGRSMPVDAAPTDVGTIALTSRQRITRASVCKGSVLDAARRARVPLRTSHFATCPDADTWRKRDHH